MLPARILGHAISLVYLRKRDRCQIPFGIPGVSPCPVIQHKGFERESRRVLRIVSGRCQPIELFTEIRFAAPADEIEPANLLEPEFERPFAQHSLPELVLPIFSWSADNPTRSRTSLTQS